MRPPLLGARRRLSLHASAQDLKLVTSGWTSHFVEALETSDPPGFGIAGPLDLNNERLMTQTFVSCVHFDIFGTYYPWRFKNW